MAHTPNTGPMTTCWEEGMSCVLSKSNDPKRKLGYTLQLTKNDASYILVNTHLANKIVGEALANKKISQLNFEDTRAEFKVGNSRFDFSMNQNKTLLEVKNVSTIDKDGMAIFPDTRSERALKHVLELTELTKNGFDCNLLFLVGREDCSQVRPAGEIMPDYLEACKAAVKEGVNILAYQCKVTESSCTIDKEIELIL